VLVKEARVCGLRPPIRINDPALHLFRGTPENGMDNESKDGITTQVATNLDPITGAAGAHPVGVGLGAAVGGIAAGAAAGTVAAGPLGTVVGAAVGAIAGGLGGKAVAEHFDPTLAGTTPSEDDLRTTSLPRLE
jgi:phage tail tape-measure protein